MEAGNYLAPRKNNMHKEDQNHNNTSWGSSCCSWPARNYCCSFCKREFRSAQALGGHMNVHRRDRARLRSSLITSSWLSTSDPSPNNNKPNPTIIINPNNTTPHDDGLSSSHPLYNNSSPCLTLSSYSSSASIISGGDKKPRLLESHRQVPLLSPPIKMISNNKNNTRSGLGLKGFVVEADDDEHKVVLKNNNDEHNNITLELGIGFHKHPNDEIEMLDLELRLGH